MTKEATCKFCHKTIQLEIDDSYAALGDVFNLMRLGACNRCADLMIRRRDIKDRAQHSAIQVLRLGKSTSSEQRSKFEGMLGNQIRKWLSLSADWHRSDEAPFDPEMVQQIMESPREVHTILTQIWQMRPEPKLL